MRRGNPGMVRAKSARLRANRPQRIDLPKALAAGPSAAAVVATRPVLQCEWQAIERQAPVSALAGAKNACSRNVTRRGTSVSASARRSTRS